MVRFSRQDPGSYTVSVRDSVKGKMIIKHYRVQHKPGGPYSIGGSQCSELVPLSAFLYAILVVVVEGSYFGNAGGSHHEIQQGDATETAMRGLALPAPLSRHNPGR